MAQVICIGFNLLISTLVSKGHVLFHGCAELRGIIHLLLLARLTGLIHTTLENMSTGILNTYSSLSTVAALTNLCAMSQRQS